MDLNRLPEDGPSDGGGGSRIGVAVSESDVVCSICLEPANKNVDRTVVKLKCKHKFHLDCIGSAFNAKRGMQCPNCRKLEIGDWQFPSGYVPTADRLNYEDEEDEEMITEDYSPQLAVSFEWCPFDNVPLFHSHSNPWNFFLNRNTHASAHEWSGPYVPAAVQEPASAYAFQAAAQPYIALLHLQGTHPGVHAVEPSMQQHYHNYQQQQQQQQSYIAPLPNPPVQTLSDSLGPVTRSGFHISSLNLGMGFLARPPANPLQDFIETGFPTSNEYLPNQGWEAAQLGESFGSSNRLNSHTQWRMQGHETTAWQPYQP